MPEPEIIIRKCKPVSAILPIKVYQEKTVLIEKSVTEPYAQHVFSLHDLRRDVPRDVEISLVVVGLGGL